MKWLKEAWRRIRRQWLLSIVLVAMATGLMAPIRLVESFKKLDLLQLERADLGLYDRGLVEFTKRKGRSNDVVIVAVDDQSEELIAENPEMFQRYQKWPYHRDVWSDLAQHLVDEGARAVVIDFTMDGKASDGDLAMARVLRANHLPVYIGIAASPSAKVLPVVKAVNVFPGELTPPAPTLKPSAVEQAEFVPDEQSPEVSEEEVANALAFPVRLEGGLHLPTLPKQKDRDQKDRASWPRSPSTPLIGALAGVGLVEMEEDFDGILRRTRFAYTDGENEYVTLSVAAAADLLGAREIVLAPGRLKIGPRELRVTTTRNEQGDLEASAGIDYGGKFDKRFESFPLFYVLMDGVLKRTNPQKRRPELQGAFRDKVVFVGGTGIGTADVKATPFQSQVPGVVKHAAVMDSLLTGAFITKAPLSVSLLIGLVMAALAVLLVLATRAIAVEILLPLALYSGFYVITGLMLAEFKLHIDSALGMGAGILGSIFATAANHLFADQERERMKQMFSRYLSPQVVDQLSHQEELPKLEGEAVEITAFFSDIRGFSTFSEKYKEDPSRLVQILNTYLTRVSAALLQHGACLDKYIGDAVVCIFGTPVRHPDHAIRACLGALAARDEVSRIRQEFAMKGLPDVYTRIGVNSAVMFVGNVGSEQLFNYTAIGDGMNLAARLEAANKNYDTQVMIGQRTYELAKDHIEVRELDRIRVAGKTEPATVYELLSLKGQLPEEKRRVVRLYEEALGHYRDARFDLALGALGKVLELDPSDGPSKVLAAKCEKQRARPVGSPFDAVTSLEK